MPISVWRGGDTRSTDCPLDLVNLRFFFQTNSLSWLRFVSTVRVILWVTHSCLVRFVAAVVRNYCCTVLPPGDYEPSQSSFLGEEGDQGDGDTETATMLVTPRTSAAHAGNELAAILTGLTATILLLAALLTLACFWRRRRCISCLSKHYVLHLLD